MQGSSRVLSMIALGVGIILAITIVFGSWYTIDQGERGVILRWGAYVSTAEPGLGFKLPMVDEVQRISVHSNARRYTAEAYSRDQQPANLTISVNYHIIPADVEQVYAQYRSEEGLVTRLIDPRVLQEVKTIFGQFNAVTAIQERARLNMEALKAVQVAVKGPVVIESLQIENIDFSDAYENSVEQRMLAEVEVQRLRQNAEREKVQAQITVTRATATADAVKAQADADAYATRVKGEAEALAIKSRGDALRENPQLVNLTTAEKWNGVLPQQMVPGSTVPFLNVGRQ
jgi:regulator of protease activity HflC (stomatin/prohibitin superfamily)